MVHCIARNIMYKYTINCIHGCLGFTATVQRGTFINPERRVRSLKYAYKQRLRASCESNKRVLANNPERRAKQARHP